MLPPVNTGSVLALRAQILAQSNAISQVAATAAPAVAAPPQFATAMQDALKSVSAIQGKASAATDAYERGDSQDLAGVMIARQKASIAFEATLQVRNRLLGAYKDVMSMPL
ncbi:flagellar hook-basal body complex protein FliE [Sandarakinorhabdus sp. DWP1-3-1]|uniref:flagellar hook-basal body complex protein FliE n=1 Tax=Sandarakinorhabdus sp. DWP1-3-1 TaxID=2804627 RepID=UPI003CF40B73